MRGSIIFTGLSLVGLRLGVKTQTRRLLDPQPTWKFRGNQKRGAVVHLDPDGRFVATVGFGGACERWTGRCPYGPAGSELWVRETWSAPSEYDGMPPNQIPRGAAIHYLADGRKPAGAGRVRSPLFLPRWASRWAVKLRVIRLQRLQQVTEEDARAEGVIPFGHYWRFCGDDRIEWTTARGAFSMGWDLMHREGSAASWESDPFVWVLDFEASALRRAA